MKLAMKHWLFLSALVLLTNGCALLGSGQASSGALARTLECKHLIAHNLGLSAMLKRAPGAPPGKTPMALAGPLVVPRWS